MSEHRLAVAPDLPDADLARVADTIAELLGGPDRTTRRAIAARIGDAYAGLDEVGRRRFLLLLAGTPGCAEVLRVVTGLPDGVQLLVDLRVDLLAIRRDDPALGFLHEELTAHLSTLFDVGLLELRRITWEGASAALLDNLVAYKGMHPILGLDDLKLHLARDRRCYGLFHAAMPDEPLVFVEAALMQSIPREATPLLDPDRTVLDEADVDTAVFFSVASRQGGGPAAALGNDAVVQALEALRHELPAVTTFATFSPIAGFRRWLDERMASDGLSAFEREAVGDELRPDDPAWMARARPGLLSLCARYLTTMEHGRAIDQTANFHQSNGASLGRLNWLANPVPLRMGQSFGMMVNYHYDLDAIASNARRYRNGEATAASDGVRSLVQ